MHIHLPYCVRRKRRSNRILVEVGGRRQIVEDAAAHLFKERGFTVLEGDEVSAFISSFLVYPKVSQEESSLYGDVFLNYVVYNGYSQEEAVKFRSLQRTLLRKYLQGNDSIFKDMLSNAFDLAWKYYIRKEYTKERVVGKIEIGDEASITIGFQKSKALLQKEKSFAQSKKVFLKTLTDEFFKKCLSKKELRILIQAYANNDIGRGSPDLFVFNTEKKTWFFVEVKSASDTLSKHQYAWIEFIQTHIGERILLLRIMPSDA